MDDSARPQGGSSFPLRILMTTDTVGGVWSYSIDLGRRLVEDGCEVVLATMGPYPTTAQRAEAAAIHGLTLSESDFDLEWLPSVSEASLAESGAWLLSLADRYRPALVHLNGYAHAGLPWSCPTVVVAHSCVASWWRAVHGEDPPSEWDAYRNRVRNGLASACAVVAPTRWILNELRAAYGLALSHAQVIYNFAAPVAHAAAQAKQETICAVGRVWDAGKNFRVLDEAAHELPWPVHVLGDGEGPGGNNRRPSKLNLRGVLPRAAVSELLSTAAVYAHPALYEPFGLSVLEAAHHGCALVLSNTASLRELWNGAALFADPRTASQWTGQLNLLIADPALCARLARKAKERAEYFSPEASVKAYRQLYTLQTDTTGALTA